MTKISDSWDSYIHKWIKEQRGIAHLCMIDKDHKAKKFQWANISRKYLKDINDWIMLCPKCHAIFDEKNLTVEQLRKRNEGRKILLEKLENGEVDFSINLTNIILPKLIKPIKYTPVTIKKKPIKIPIVSFSIKPLVIFDNTQYFLNRNSSPTNLHKLKLEYLKKIFPTENQPKQLEKHVHIRGVTYTEYFE